MTHVFVADAKSEERSALRLLLLDLNMEVVGQADDWAATLSNAPATHPDMVLVEWNLLPIDLGAQALAELRLACSSAIIIVLISQLNVRHQAALSSGADIFISKGELPECVAERLQAAAERILR